MSFLEKGAAVDFSVNDISDYSSKLGVSADKAEEIFRETIELSNKINEALEDVIAVGQNNLGVCESELEWCKRQINAVEEKIKTIEGIVKNIESTLCRVDEQISSVNSAYKNACAQADRIRNTAVNSEQERNARASALSRTQGYVDTCRNEKAKLDGMRGRLYNAKLEAESDISKLRNIRSELNLINTHLEQEKNKISSAVYNAELLISRLRECENALKQSFDKNINKGLLTCCQTVGNALTHAREAISIMSELNGVGYDEYERIVVTDLAGLSTDAENMRYNISAMVTRFKEIYGICEKYGDMMQDKIMDRSLNLIDKLSNEERDAINYMIKKSEQLRGLCSGLSKYYKTKM